MRTFLSKKFYTITRSSEDAMKLGDTTPPYTAYLSEVLDGEVVPVDVTDYEVTFIMIDSVSGEEKVNSSGTVVDGPGGIVKYEWQTGDTDTPGVYKILIQLITVDEKIRTFPSEGFDSLTIEKISNL